MLHKKKLRTKVFCGCDGYNITYWLTYNVDQAFLTIALMIHTRAFQHVLLDNKATCDESTHPKVSVRWC